MRFLGVTAFAVAIFVGMSIVPSAVSLPVPHGPDGVTAKIQNGWGPTHLTWQPDASGNYVARVSLYSNASGAWQAVSVNATLRVFVAGDITDPTNPVLDWSDRVSIPFTTKAGSTTSIPFPASAIHSDFAGPRLLDVFVTFSELGGDPVPTSHFNLVRNTLIDRGSFDLADLVDYYGTQYPVALGA